MDRFTSTYLATANQCWSQKTEQAKAKVIYCDNRDPFTFTKDNSKSRNIGK